MTELPDLSRYTEPELREIVARASFLLGRSSADKQDASDYSGYPALVHEVLAEFLRKRRREAPPFAVVKRNASWPEYRDRAIGLVRYIHTAIEPKNRVELRASLSVSFGLLADFLQFIGTPISFRSLSNNLERVPDQFDRAFPGYSLSPGRLRFAVLRPVQEKSPREP